MADIKQITIPDGTIYSLKDASAVANVSYNNLTNVITITKRDGTSSTITLADSGNSDIWVGTKTAYDNISTKNSETVYVTSDETTSTFVNSDTLAAHIAATNPHNITAATINAYTQAQVDAKEIALNGSISSVSGRVSTLENNINNIPAVRYGTTTPSASLGSNGDIYIQYSE